MRGRRGRFRGFGRLVGGRWVVCVGFGGVGMALEGDS